MKLKWQPGGVVAGVNPGQTCEVKWVSMAGNTGPLGKLMENGIPGPVVVTLPLMKLAKGAIRPGLIGASMVFQAVILTDAWLGATATPRLVRS